MGLQTLDFERPILELEKKVEELRILHSEGLDSHRRLRRLERRLERLRERIFRRLTPWQRIQLARHLDRPHTLDYIDLMAEEFVELHGDRMGGDDPAIVGGLMRVEGLPVVVVGHQKGRSLKERARRNFGMPHPEGYRKAMRLMELAERFYRPLISMIDTPGAYPGVGAEARGQPEAIANSILRMCTLRTPTLAVVIGEGGSGGALAIGVADRVLMLEHAIYTVISPEGCAAILWRDESKKEEAAAALRLTARDAKEFHLIDEIVPEPPGGAHRDPKEAARLLKEACLKHLKELTSLPLEERLKRRYSRYRAMGAFKYEEEG